MAEFNFVKITENEIPNLDKNCGFVLKFSAPEYDKAKKEVKIAKYYLFGDKYRRMYNILFDSDSQASHEERNAIGLQGNIAQYLFRYKQVIDKMTDKPSLAFINYSSYKIDKKAFKDYHISENGQVENYYQPFVTKVQDNVIQFLENLIEKRTNPNTASNNIIIFIFQFDKLGLDLSRFVKVLTQAASRHIYFVIDISDEKAFRSNANKIDLEFFDTYFPIRFENGAPIGEIKKYLDQFDVDRFDITY